MLKIENMLLQPRATVLFCIVDETIDVFIHIFAFTHIYLFYILFMVLFVLCCVLLQYIYCYYLSTVLFYRLHGLDRFSSTFQ